jgi:hypothetical protein
MLLVTSPPWGREKRRRVGVFSLDNPACLPACLPAFSKMDNPQLYIGVGLVAYVGLIFLVDSISREKNEGVSQIPDPTPTAREKLSS